ncbi:MAG: hypothetical protein WBD02_00565 [Acidimicrobiia bacterium]
MESRTPTPQVARELADMVVTYAKQETVVPLKKLGRGLAFGIPGAICIAGGTLFLLMALLRGLQTETGTSLRGTWSFVPYLAVVLASAIGIIFAATRISKDVK